MIKYLVILGIFLITLVAHGVEIKNCSDDQARELQEAYNNTEKVEMRLLSEMDEVIRTREDLPNRSIKQVKKARLILKCAQKKLKKLYFQCKSDPDDLALFRTLPLIGKKVTFNTETRYLTTSVLTAAMIHEATHKCGTTDADYFIQNNKAPASTFWSEWPEIAGSYEYWIFRGFCIPEVDC